MIPWPIALLCLFYAALTAASAAAVWKIATGASGQPLVWAAAWLSLSCAVMCGLPLLKAWARTLAVFGAILMAALSLAVAGLLVISGRPMEALLATLAAGVHVLIIRYLRRPAVRAMFSAERAADHV